MLYLGTHNFLSAVYLLLFKKNEELFMLPFLHKNDKIQISQFSFKNKQIFKIIVFHSLTKIKSSCAFFSSNRQCQIVFGTEILRLFEKVLFLMYYNLRVNSPFRSRNSLIGFFPKFTMLWYVYGAQPRSGPRGCSKITRE